MNTRKRPHLSSYGIENLAPECREALLASLDPSDGEPLLLNPAMLDDLIDDLLEAGLSALGGPRCTKLRHALLRGASVYETTDGETAVLLSKPAEKFVREAISRFGKEDRVDLSARELRDALEHDESPRTPVLCGTYEETVSEKLAVPVPEGLLKGASRLYVTESDTEPGTLFCQATRRRVGEVAKLIKEEQALKGFPWEHADDFEEMFRLYAFGDEVKVIDGVLSLQEISPMPDWARPGAEVVLIGAGDHFEIADAESHAQRMDECEDDIAGMLGC